MHARANTRLVHHETDKLGEESDFGAATLQGLAKYLRNLRENRRVTQASLSTKTGAMTGRKISRSRISEIENAKRDPISERELRTYMVGLKCAPHHIDGLVKALRQSMVISSRETPADPVPSSAMPDPHPTGLGGAEDDLTLRKEKSKDDLTAAGHEEGGRERWPQEDRSVHLVDASQAQPSRRRWQRHRIAFATATALVVVALIGFGAEFLLRRESAELPTSPGSPGALLVPHNSPPLILEGTTPDFIKDGSPLYPAPVRVNKRTAQISKTQDRLDPRDTATRDTTEHLVGYCCVPKGNDQAVDAAVFPGIKPDWRGYPGGATGELRPDLGGEQLMENTKR
jgi:hypothetical protein